MEDGSVVLLLKERAVDAKEGRRTCAGVSEGGLVENSGDAVPVAIFGNEDGADDVLVELYGKDGVELVGGAEIDEVKLDGVRIGYVSVDEVLCGRTDGGE